MAEVMTEQELTRRKLGRLLLNAIEYGRDPENWSKQWTREQYGVAESVAAVLRVHGHVTLKHANEVLAAEGYQPLGPDLTTFPWGTIVRVHAIGGHHVVQAESEGEGEPFEGRRRTLVKYHTFVSDPDTGELVSCGQSFATLDQALLHCIVFTAEWVRSGDRSVAANERLTVYLRRLLEL